MEFPDLGENCNEQTCNKLDFLPVRCDACGKIFCSDHMSYENHGCPSSYKKNVQVPVCPLCNSPVPTPRNQRPDIAMSEHIDTNCTADHHKKSRAKILSNKCSVRGCKIKEMVPVICSQCRKNYCLQHRFPDIHHCNKRGRQLETEAGAQDSNSSHVKAVQGSLSEDEALARALSESMKEADRFISQNQEQTVGTSISPQRCHVS